MALLSLRLGSLLAPCLHRPHRRRRSLVVSNAASVKPPRDGGAAVVWFKHDLRVDDHPGLTAAAERCRPVVPLYVFDPRILAGYSDTILELLLSALKDFKMLLKSQESDLFIGLGNAEDVVLKLVNEVQAGLIFTEEEVEYRARSVMASVESSLSNGSFTWESPPKIVAWSAPLYDCKSMKELSTSYNLYLKEKLSTTAPIAAPALPALNVELNTGSIPTLEELKGFLKDYRTSEDNWISLKSMSAKSILRKSISERKMKSNSTSSMSNGGNMNEISMGSGTSGRRIVNSMFSSESATEVRGGSDVILDALAAYLRYLESTGKDNWQELHDKVRLVETRNGASFYTLFGSALQLGVISRRRVYCEAIQYERDRNAGFVSPFGYSTPTVTAAVDAICSMEWYWFLALKSQVSNDGNYPIRFWRWKGYLIQHTSVGHQGPAVLLVHGFGAFLEHFRDNIGSIADLGHRVWAITILGFGKSEKPNVNYTELMWSELLRDFIIDVVGEPVHLVGNSIGGYICAIAAGLWPSLAKSLVLLNSAGSVVPSYSFIPLNNDGRKSWLSRLQARLLLLYLRSRVGNILKEYYPTRTERVDKSLVDQIIRASYDPGAGTVLESIFNFNLSIPLNFLFDSFGGEILVVQGMKDPLTKSKLFVSMLREHCCKVRVRELDAGHCPHDELPNEVNSLLCEWTKEIEVKPAMEKSKAI